MTAPHPPAAPHRRRERGATLIITALVLPVLVTMSAFATDLGRQRASRRTMQARADIVALDMVRLADGRTEDQITGADPSAGTTPALYAAYVQDTADRNDVDVAKLVIDWGTWDGSTFTPTVGNAVPSAVQVVASETTDYFFRPGSGDVSRTAVATTDDIASITLGSTLAQAKAGNATLLNQILTGLVCSAPTDPPPPAALCSTQASITAGGYNGLATHDVTLDDLRAAGGYGSVDELMKAELTAEGFARLSGQAFRNNGDPSTAAIYDGQGNSLAEHAQECGNDCSFALEDVMWVKSPSDGSSAGARVNPFDLFMSGLQAANGSNFVDMTNTLPPMSLPVGVSNLTLTSRYQVVQAPAKCVGRVGSCTWAQLRTAQISVTHSLSFDLALAAGGVGVSGPVTLPVVFTGGGAIGNLSKITCAQPAANSTIDVDTAPRVIDGTIGKSFTYASPNPSQAIGAMTVTGLGLLPLSGVNLYAYGAIDPGAQNSSASPNPAIAIGEIRAAPGSTFGLGGGVTSVKLDTTPATTVLEQPLEIALDGVLAELDSAATPAMNALGLSVSSSDVGNVGVNCEAVRLAG